jgi:hypothetical protein
VPKRSDTGTATLEAPRRPPEAVAAAAAEKSESLRREALATDWRSWRAIVEAIAAGKEPDGRQLAEIAALATRLRLPEGALASAVKAIGRERELRQDEERARDRLAVAGERGPLLVAEVEAARLKLDELLAEQRKLATYPASVAAAIRAVADHRKDNPLAFLPETELVERSIRSQSRGVLKISDADEEGWSL